MSLDNALISRLALYIYLTLKCREKQTDRYWKEKKISLSFEQKKKHFLLSSKQVSLFHSWPIITKETILRSYSLSGQCFDASWRKVWPLLAAAVAGRLRFSDNLPGWELQDITDCWSRMACLPIIGSRVDGRRPMEWERKAKRKNKRERSGWDEGSLGSLVMDSAMFAEWQWK